MFSSKKILSAIVIATLASTSVSAAPPKTNSAPLETGSLTAPTITAVAVTAGVATALLANAQGQALPITTTSTLSCVDGDDLVNGVCVRTGSTVTVTGTGTGTGTTTMTVPVTTTYAPSRN